MCTLSHHTCNMCISVQLGPMLKVQDEAGNGAGAFFEVNLTGIHQQMLSLACISRPSSLPGDSEANFMSRTIDFWSVSR